MRDAVIAAMAAVMAAQTTIDRNAAVAALLAILDAGLAATPAWSPPPATATPVIAAPSPQKFDSGGQVPIPTVATVFYTTTCFITKLEITNQGSGPATISVWDGNGDFLIPPRSLPAGEIETYTDTEGRRMVGGVNWQASADGCKAYVRWQNAF